MFNQKTDSSYYDVFPRIVLCNQTSKITVKPKGQHVAFEDKLYLVIVFPVDSCVDIPGAGPGQFIGIHASTYKVMPDNGNIVITHMFTKEQLYNICICDIADETNVIMRTGIYCLKEDLYERRPFKIETHSHTNRSDGSESPEFVPPYYRMHGYDVLAITDHSRYQPSLEAIHAFSGVKTGLNLLAGEEVHAPFNTLHIINLGGGFSVNDIFKNDFDSYDKQVRKIIEETDIPEQYDKYKVASCIWVSKMIRKGGGLCIMGHPYYRPSKNRALIKSDNSDDRFKVNRMVLNHNIPSDMFIYLLQLGIFDAWEICGFSPERNNGHLSLYLEMLRNKMDMPVVAANDSHGVESLKEYFNKVFTIVFAKDNSADSIMSEIKAGCCVAIANHDPEQHTIYGHPRLMRYARFLIDYFYPEYKRICFHEGNIMKDYVTGQKGAKQELERIYERPSKYMEHFFRGSEYSY